MKTLIYVSIILFLFISLEQAQTALNLNNSNCSYDSSVIKLKSSKDKYLESEPIWIEVEINIPEELKLDSSPVIYPNNDIKFYLNNDKGDTLKGFGGDVTTVLMKKYKNHYYSIFHLQYFFGVADDFPHSLLAYRYKLLPDNYYLKATLHLVINGKANFFNSDGIHFRVERPDGDEIEARKQLLEIEDYATSYSSTISSIEKFNSLYEKVAVFENLYPGSVYLPKIQDLIVGFSSNSNFRDTMNIYLLRKIKENPDNYYNESNLGLIISIFPDDSNNSTEFLINLRESYKGTLLEKFIDNELEEIEFEKSIRQ